MTISVHPFPPTSVMAQTHTPDEVLVMNDGSTDDTLSILGSYGHGVTVLTQKKSGVAAARNALCKRAHGELIALLDNDDIWHASYLATKSTLFRQHPRACGFYTGRLEGTLMRGFR